LEAITGASQASAFPAAAARGSSVRETAMASKPLKVCSEWAALKLAVRLA
jgi:hypothetical protein